MTAFNNKNRRGSKVEWISPPELVNALGPFDLDPCAPVKPPFEIAPLTFTVETDGLRSEWPREAFSWCNFPYDNNLYTWFRKLYHHPAGGIALLFARTGTRYFRDWIWKKADAVLFLTGRLTFLHVDGRVAEKNSGCDSVLVAYRQKAVVRLRELDPDKFPGCYIDLGANRVRTAGQMGQRLFDVG